MENKITEVICNAIINNPGDWEKIDSGNSLYVAVIENTKRCITLSFATAKSLLFVYYPTVTITRFTDKMVLDCKNSAKTYAQYSIWDKNRSYNDRENFMQSVIDAFEEN